MKLFTVFYVLLGIGILVDILRRLRFAFVSVRASDERQELWQPRPERQGSFFFLTLMLT
jgi:hypothetical protein